MSVDGVLKPTATVASGNGSGCDGDGGDSGAAADAALVTTPVRDGAAALSEEYKVHESDVQNTVGVIVRVRPLSTVEHADPSVKTVVNCLKDSIVVNGGMLASSRYFGARNALPRPQHFKVDKVFHPHSTQIEVYAACRSIVAGVFDGINGSILAYGATGSGKTHTMFGGNMSVAGVIYQAVQDILEAKERLETEDDKIVTVRCTFLEVYNEEVFDLLAPTSPRGKRTALKVQDLGHDDNATGEEGGSGGVNPESLYVKGLTYISPDTAEDFAKCVEQGHTNRFVASTSANAQSSRSHAILTVEVEVKDRVDASLGTVGRIRFCDLAGSERAAGTTNSGIRLREGGNINRSLLALGAVVQALAQRKKNNKKSIYVPYRGSKLTRLLRDCLGGNCRTLMLFCVSPSNVQYEETVNTMLFAMRAKEIQVAAKRHEFQVDSKEVAKSQEALIEDLRMELALARDELLRLKGGNFTGSMGRAPFSMQSSQLPLNSPSVAPLSSRKGDVVQVLSAGPLTFDTTEGRPDSLEASPAQVQPSHRLSLRMSVMNEGSEAYTELQNKLKTFSVAKETLYREMREAEQSNSELDMRLRQHKWKLARFLSTRKRGSNTEGDGGKATPVGVAGLRHAIEQMEAESLAQGGEMERLLAKMNATDRTIANIRGELLREKQHPHLELLLDNVKLRQSCTEAECLAAHYHQECRSSMNREEEYAQALGICVSAIRHMLPLACSNPVAREEAQLALIFANLPSLSTPDMIAVFERSMNSGSTPSTWALESFRSASSVVSMEARLERIVQDRTSIKDISARPIPLRKLKRNGVNTSRKDKVSRITDVKSNNVPMASKKRRTGPEPFVSSYSTTGLRRLTPNGTAPLRKSPESNGLFRPSDGKKSVSFAPTKKVKISNGMPSRHMNNVAVGQATAATKTVMKSGGIKTSTSPTPFSRSHTASEALHESRHKNGNLAAPFGHRGASQEREKKLRQSPPSRGYFNTKKENGDAARHRRNHVTFMQNGGDSTTTTTAAAVASGTPKKRLYNADLVERYDKLLSEVRQWHHDVGNAASRSNHATRGSVRTP